MSILSAFFRCAGARINRAKVSIKKPQKTGAKEEGASFGPLQASEGTSYYDYSVVFGFNKKGGSFLLLII